jgi:alpha-beta hydrolase superfamily lysophospholipase
VPTTDDTPNQADEAPVAGYRSTTDGVRQYHRRWPIDDPIAALQIVHGIGEHSGRYTHVGRFFAKHRYDVALYDNRGFGKTEWPRGHVDSFDQYLDDIEESLAERRELGVPVVLYGHSLGGLMVTRYLTADRPQPDLAVLSAPAIDAEVPAWQRVAAPVLGRVIPKLFVAAKATGEGLSTDDAVGQAFVDDPLLVEGATARMGLEVFDAMKAAAADLDRISVPTYVLHGDADPVVPQRHTKPLAALDLVTYRTWPGLLHECHNEPQQGEVLGEIEAWLNERLSELS